MTIPDPTVYPGAADTWYDGIDSDCAGNGDFDQDGDGQDARQFGGETIAMMVTIPPMLEPQKFGMTALIKTVATTLIMTKMAMDKI